MDVANIKINGVEYKLKYTLRALFVFEKITGAAFAIESTLDYYILFYSVLLANNQDTFKLTFDEFIDICDNDSSLFFKFSNFLNKEIEMQNQFKKSNTNGEDDSKKKV